MDTTTVLEACLDDTRHGLRDGALSRFKPFVDVLLEALQARISTGIPSHDPWCIRFRAAQASLWRVALELDYEHPRLLPALVDRFVTDLLPGRLGPCVAGLSDIAGKWPDLFERKVHLLLPLLRLRAEELSRGLSYRREGELDPTEERPF
ncbi:hypothetical protein OC835_008071, partial [Tilletia horrida]